MQAGFAVAAFAVAMTATVTAYAQGGHEGHQTKTPDAQHQDHHKMTMPAMDDTHFVEMMKKHHQEGIEIAKIEESKGTRADVKALATKIRQGQEKDLTELNAHEGKHSGGAHGAAPDKAQGTTGHATHDAKMQEHHKMMEQMAQQSKQKIETASGAEVDHAFAREMAMHHEMAIEMIAKATLKDPELRKFAQRMAATQKKELQELKAAQQAK
jgi:uncharacterized protein (DUF305 family)